MDKYNLSPIANYTTISRIKRAKCNRNIYKIHKQLCAFTSSTKNKREVRELATYYRKLSLISWNITDHFFLLLFIYRLISSEKKCLKILNSGLCTNLYSSSTMCGTFVADRAHSSHEWRQVPRSALRNALLEISKSINTFRATNAFYIWQNDLYVSHLASSCSIGSSETSRECSGVVLSFDINMYIISLY